MSSPLRAPRQTKEKPASLARSNITACIRCRQKKKRCDQRLPKCGLCQTAGTECVGYDAVARREIPRSYILSLEERVAYLELTLQRHGIQYQGLDGVEGTPSPWNPATFDRNEEIPTSPSLEIEDQRTINAVRAAQERVQKPAIECAEDEPAFSRIFLKQLMQSKHSQGFSRYCGSDSDVAKNALLSDLVVDLDTAPVSLPTKEAADMLIKTFFQFANHGMPLLHEPTFRLKMDIIYSTPALNDLVHDQNKELKMAMFFVFEVFAIALVVMQKQDPSKVPTSLADRYHQAALQALHTVGLTNDVQGVEVLLLVGMYSYYHPTTWAAYKTIGAALRLAVELGLHQEPPPAQLNPLSLDIRRRVFWVAYSMDRSIGLVLALPPCLPDGEITTEFPSIADDQNITEEGIQQHADTSFHAKSLSLHLFRYRQLQSEMRAVLFEKSSLGCAHIDRDLWQSNMHERLKKWFNETPREGNLTLYQARDVELYELSFHRALFYLYHPSPNMPTLSEAALIALTDAATRVIELYRRFFLEHRITLYWQVVENISSAGITLMYTFIDCSKVRERMSFHSLESLIRSCSSVLWGVVEHFPAFSGKRDAFDIIASKVLATLTSSPPAQDGPQNLISNVTPENGMQMGGRDISSNWLEDQAQVDVSHLLHMSVASTTQDFQTGPSTFSDTAAAQSDADLDRGSNNLMSQVSGQPPLSFDWDNLQNPEEFLTSAWM